MPLSRKKRTSLFRQRVEKEWSEYYWEFVLKYSYKLDWYGISKNPNITMDIILANLDEDWDWYYISRNPFTKDKEEFQVKIYREHIAAVLIQNAYKNALVNENCKIGKNKIERDMEFAGVEL